MTSLAVGLWLSALNVKYRDFQYTIPFLIQLWLFASPVVYPGSMLLPQQWQFLYALNPMVGVIEGFRWALLGTNPPEAMILVSVVLLFFSLSEACFTSRGWSSTLRMWYEMRTRFFLSGDPDV